jgi:hypothetical protein
MNPHMARTYNVITHGSIIVVDQLEIIFFFFKNLLTPLVVYQVALARHWLIMGLKTDNSLIDM